MQAKFTQGSIFRHINVMTFSSTIGLIALFLVDLADMYFLSLLGQVAINAAIGYAGSVLFFTLSICIGLSIGCGALIAQVIGKGDREAARRLIVHMMMAMFGITVLASALVIWQLDQLLIWLGADGEAKQLAIRYINIIMPSTPFLAIAMGCSGIIRALGEARAAMNLSLVAAGVNGLLDPLFIFGFGWGIEGAAAATVVSRIAMMLFGLWIVIKTHQLLGLPNKMLWKTDIKQFLGIAFPAVLTNLSTPIGLAYVTYVMASFGDAAVAGQAIVGRIQPVIFAGLFALSGSIGPIAAQNFGAGQFDRIFETLHKSLLFVLIYCAAACAILLMTTPFILAAFKIDDLTADIVRWFCYGFSLIFLFNGATFVTNALFNNLRAATYATQFNFGKATLGTIPFAYLGAQWGGPLGIYWGTLIGAAIIAILGIWICQRHIHTLKRKASLPL